MKNSTAARSALGTVVALLASLFSISCGNVMLHPNQAATASGAVSVNASSVNFGNVSVGMSKTSSVTLTNSAPSGGASITFSQVKASGAGFSASTSHLPIVLAPGASLRVTILFSPRSSGMARGNLAITENGDSDPSMVALSGMGVGAGQLAVSPSTLVFGNVAVGSNQHRIGMLTAGPTSVTVSSAAWNGQGYSVSGISFPFTIPSGQSIPFTVTFAPQSSGSSAGSISFVSDASNSPTHEMLSGSGGQTQGTSTGSSLHHVDLAWDPSTSAVSGYYVYRGTGGNFARLNSSPQTDTTYSDDSVQSGTTYFYVTTAVDSSGIESARSNQVSAAVP